MQPVLKRGEIVVTLIGLALGVLMSALDNTIVGTAMPKVIRDLSGVELYSWPFTAYLLASTIAIPIFGRLADRLGRRLVFIAGLIEFIAASVLCGAAQNMTLFIIFRGLQGLGGGILISNAFALAGEISSPQQRGAFMGIIGSMFGIAGLIGPSLGGVLADGPGWRWAFYINVPIGALALGILAIGLRHLQEQRQSIRLNPLSIVFFILAVGPLMLALSWGGREYAWGDPVIFGLFAAALLFGLTFFLVERRSQHALLPKWLFQATNFKLAVIASFLSNAVFLGAVLFLPLWLQEVLGTSAAASGLALTPMLLAYTVAAVVGGNVIGRLSRLRWYAVITSLLAVGGLFWLCTITPQAGIGPVTIAMVIIGLGLGANNPVFTILAQDSVEPRSIGLATATVNFFRNLGAAVGTAVMGSVFIQQLTLGLTKVDFNHLPNFLVAELKNPNVLMNSSTIHSLVKQVPDALQPVFKNALGQIDQSLAVALLAVFGVMLIVALLATLPTLFVQARPKPAWRNTQTTDGITQPVSE